jgi:hypothetical protein
MPLNESRNAIELLKHDHREVESLFAELKSETSDERKLELGRSICIELTVHAQIEEELFYPAAKEALPAQKSQDLVGEATVEHASLKQLIADIDGSAPGEELFDARFTVLEEYVKHHVKEEEEELMPAMERTQVDLDALGAALAERKEDLKAALEGSASGSRRARRIALPKLRARRSGAGTQSRTASRSKRGADGTTQRRRGTAGRKQAPARKRAAAASRQSTPKARRSGGAKTTSARKSGGAKTTSARKRTQNRRARSARG